MVPFLLLLLQPPRETPTRPVVINGASVVAFEQDQTFEALEFRLTNATAAITGYGVRYILTFADGKTRTGGFGVLGR